MQIRTHALGLLTATLLQITPAHALDLQFTFPGVAPPPGSSLFGRTWQPGDLVGVLHGLASDGLLQLPSAVSFVSGYAPVGLSQLHFDAADWTLAMGGLNLAGGVITSGSLHLNLADPVLGGRVLTFNVAVFGPPTHYNALAWNGLPANGHDDGLRPGVGNGLGFGGAIYGPVSAVPEPSALWLWGLGSGLLGLAGRRKLLRP